MTGVQIYDMRDPGFHPAITFEGWKVAIFNDADIWKEENISYLQKHNQSDEVFILLTGECTLILSEEKVPETMYAVKMLPGKVYNIPKGTWHSHILGKDTKVIVVENSDTALENSPKTALPYPIRLTKMEYY